MKYPKVSIIALMLFVLSIFVPYICGQPEVTPSELFFVIYADGYVGVEYEMNVDPTKSRVNVSLFGELFEFLIIEDQDGFPLDSSFIEGGLTIDTLGAISATISYQTTDLTGKDGQIWTFTVQTPISSSIVLPEEATIRSLIPMPLAMSDLNGNIMLTMPAESLEVSYTLGAVGTKEHAIAVINDAEAEIQSIKVQGVVTQPADTVLQQAYESYEAESYYEAEILAGQAKSLALTLLDYFLEASEEIEDAHDAVATAHSSGRTVGLENAIDLLTQAEDAFDLGDYEEASNIAKLAISSATSASAPEPGEWVNIFFLGVVTLVFVSAAAFFFIRNKRSKSVVISPIKYDIEGLFENKPHLRLDDKEVIRFLSDSGGEAFAAELRVRFNIPRTSLWRMIRRLEREDVVEVRNIGGQSLIRINQRYAIGGADL